MTPEENMRKTEELQEKLLDEMLRILNEGVTAVDKDGNVVRCTPPASYLAVMKDYLKAFAPSKDPASIPSQPAAKPVGMLAQFEKRLPFPMRSELPS